MSTIRSRYGGTCSECGRTIPADTAVEWDRASRQIRHVKCPVSLPPVPPGAVRQTMTGETKYEAPAVGHVFRDRPTGQILTVLRVTARYIREDGMSFGLMDESGWLFDLTCRPATDAEAAPILAAEQAAETKRRAKHRATEIARQIQERGERPAGSHTTEGERILDSQTLYGGGNWFAVGREHIWYCQNNGGDGDDWSRNNVRTGGAGAIGWRIPFDQDLADELIALGSVLMPAAAQERSAR